MVSQSLSDLNLTPVFLALLLGATAITAPELNQKGGPPRSVFLILPEGSASPTVSIESEELGNGRYRLRLNTTDFRFTAICSPKAEPVPIGHAHIHVDGKKVTSAFVPIVEIGPLPPGDHLITAVMRGKDHRAIVGRNGLAQGSVAVTVPAGPA